MILRAFLIWCVMLVLAILNGAVRTAWITPRSGELVGHWVSTILFCALIMVVSSMSIEWISPHGTRQALAVGLFWVALTIAFEFLGGHYLFGNSWERLFADYNLFKGRVWLLVLIATGISPMWAAHMRGL